MPLEVVHYQGLLTFVSKGIRGASFKGIFCYGNSNDESPFIDDYHKVVGQYFYLGYPNGPLG